VGQRPWQAKLNISVSAASLRDRGKAEILHSGYLLPKKPKNQCLPVKYLALHTPVYLYTKFQPWPK